MLKIFRSLKELDLAQLYAIYEQSNQLRGREDYPLLSENLQILQAQQDFYAYLRLFFAQQNSVYAVWAPDGAYKAALRLESYADGLLLAGLETLPDARGEGNATALVREVLYYLSVSGHTKVYSHVDKKNTASLRVHELCGFDRILEHAVYSDGSVLHSSCSLCVVT